MIGRNECIESAREEERKRKARLKLIDTNQKHIETETVPFELSFIDFIRCTVFLKIDSSICFHPSIQLYVGFSFFVFFYQSKITCSIQRVNRKFGELNECFSSPLAASDVLPNMMWKRKPTTKIAQKNECRKSSRNKERIILPLKAPTDLLLHLFRLLFIYLLVYYIRACNSSGSNLSSICCGF